MKELQIKYKYHISVSNKNNLFNIWLTANKQAKNQNQQFIETVFLVIFLTIPILIHKSDS